MFTPQFTKLLGITKHELQVLRCTEFEKKSITEISKTTKIPRTTLYTAIDSLTARGLVQKNNIGNKTIISVTDRTKINSLLFTESTRGNSDIEIEELNDFKKPNFEVVYGVASLIGIYEKISNSKNERVFAIQPTLSMQSAVSAISPEKLVSINKAIKKNKVIFESIIHQDYMKQYVAQYLSEQNYTKITDDIISSLRERMSDLSFIDKTYLNVNTELLFTKNELYLINWKDASCVEIRNKEMITFIKEMFLFVKKHSNKVNYHSFINGNHS